MKQALRNLAAVVCLLIILVGSGVCMGMTTHRQKPASCSDCTKHVPQQQKEPCWCSVHQQPSATVAIATIDQSALISDFRVPVLSLDVVAFLTSQTGHGGPAQPPPLITLRI